MNRNLLSYGICPECKEDEIDIEIYASEYESIGQGSLVKHGIASKCGIPDLLPLSLRNIKRYEAFDREHNLFF
ncbi:MAG: hypothetical protein E4G98_05225 [Promethearchaeota archaeon]|nr:MAG: hypothetical protein E4G98_05225 [Candidatus Lokiarchaeota archaeon]